MGPYIWWIWSKTDLYTWSFVKELLSIVFKKFTNIFKATYVFHGELLDSYVILKIKITQFQAIDWSQNKLLCQVIKF